MILLGHRLRDGLAGELRVKVLEVKLARLREFRNREDVRMGNRKEGKKGGNTHHARVEGWLVLAIEELLPVNSLEKGMPGNLLGVFLAAQSLFRLTHQKLLVCNLV